MIRAILAISILALACGGGGGSDPSPTDVCNDYCDRLSECGWYLPEWGNPCNAGLCDGPIAFYEGDDESCDAAAVAYFKCGKKASCSSLEFEPCPGQFEKLERECAFAFQDVYGAAGQAGEAQVAKAQVVE